MDLSFDVTWLGALFLLLGSVAFAVALGLSDLDRTALGWIMPGVGAFIGGFVASELLWLDAYEPVWEGIAWVPAIVGGLVTGFVVEATMRWLGRSPTIHGANPI